MKTSLLRRACLFGLAAAFSVVAARAETRNARLSPVGVGTHASVGEISPRGATGPLPNTQRSTVTSVTPAVSGAGLIIDPTFDSSITSSPNAAAIESAINAAITALQARFSDPVRVAILFRYATTQVNGTVMPSQQAAGSYFVYYGVPWGTYINALLGDAKTSNDSTANASLPASALSTNIRVNSANGRAVSLDTPPALFADGTVAPGGQYDGIVTLNSARPFGFSRPVSDSQFDAPRFLEHEIDEVLGLGSRLNGTGTDLRPQDLFSWSSAGVRSQATTGSRYFSIDGGRTFIVGFNQQSGYDYGDWFSTACPQANPYVQNAYGCVGQSSDVTDMSPEGVNLDVVGYDLASAIQRVQVTVQASMPGVAFAVDGVGYASAQTFSWIYGSSHTVGTSTPQSAGTGVQYGFTGWSDSGAITHNVTATSPMTLTAVFVKQYLLQIASNGSGITSPATGWYDSGLQLALEATPNAGYTFTGWSGTGPGSYTGSDSGGGVTMNGPISETATFASDASPSPTPSPSPTATPSPSGSPAQLLNLSTRLRVGVDDDVLIGGFIITGNDSKQVMLRAIGPSLSVPNTLRDPVLELYLPDGSKISNNDWKIDDATGQSQEAEINATGLAPANDAESALAVTLAPGAYTAVVRGNSSGTGVGLVEVYDLEMPSSRLENLSSRGSVTSGDNVLIGGIIVGADSPSGKVVLRGIGPSLPIGNALPNPRLQVYNGNGDEIASNDDWQSDPAASEIAADGLAPSDPREAAVLRVLTPGAYTAVVTSQDANSGVALVDIFAAP